VTVILLAMRGARLEPDLIVVLAILALANMTAWVYIVCIFIWVVLSWLQASYTPIAMFLGQLIDPVLRPARRLLPVIGGFDLSPMIVSILLVAIVIALRDVLAIFVS
jgi:YggT family protein